MTTEVTKPKTMLEACRLTAKAAASWWADHLDLCEAEENKREEFREVLFTGIFWEFLNNLDRACAKELLLVDDDGPRLAPLKWAQEFADIEDEAFPTFTEMWISLKEVRVRGSGPKVLDPEYIIYRAEV